MAPDFLKIINIKGPDKRMIKRHFSFSVLLFFSFVPFFSCGQGPPPKAPASAFFEKSQAFGSNQQNKISLEARAAEGPFLSAETIRVVVKAQLPEGTILSFEKHLPAFSSAESTAPDAFPESGQGAFVLVREEKGQPVEEEGIRTVYFDFFFKAGLPVPHQGGSLLFRSSDGSDLSLKLGERQIKSILPQQGKQLDFQDIESPGKLGGLSRFWLIIILSASFLLLALIFCLWFFWLRKKGQKPPQYIAAHIDALEDLDKLSRQKIQDREALRLFYFKLSLILRIYLEKRFDFPAAEQTSEELLPVLRNSPELSLEQKSRLRQFFQSTDLIKFANQEASMEEALQDLSFCRSFIQKSRESDYEIRRKQEKLDQEYAS